MLFEINGSVVPKDYWKAPQQYAKMAKAFTVKVAGEPASTADSTFLNKKCVYIQQIIMRPNLKSSIMEQKCFICVILSRGL